ncbi:MAG: right-handed parallel beta-helix repeat-containing protein [Dermatophilaceae bacterium]
MAAVLVVVAGGAAMPPAQARVDAGAAQAGVDAGAAQVDLYAAPAGTGSACTQEAPCSLTAARDAARAANDAMQGDVVVNLAGGRYALTETFTLDGQDSGGNGHQVVYRSDPAQPAVLSGGREITGWQKQPDGSYRASVPDGTTFRQMWVEGKTTTRARNPRAGQYKRLTSWDDTNERIAVPSDQVPAMADISGVEIVVKRHWTQHRMRVESIERGPDGTTWITPEQEESDITFHTDHPPRRADQTYFLENAAELLDAPGEFFLDQAADQVTYIPREGETMTEVYVPSLQTVLDVRGTPASPVQDVTFSGITVAHGAWTVPDTRGFINGQAHVGKNGSGIIPGAAEVRYANRVLFTRCVFELTGGNGINLDVGSKNVTLDRNTARNLSGQGLVADASVTNTTKEVNTVTDITMTNNTVERIGLDYTGSVGIFVGFVSKARVEHNDVSHTPYSGISVGWGWEVGDTIMRDNVIRANDVSGAMYLHDDGAGIYVRSKQPNSVISHNYVHGIRRSDWAETSPVVAVYLDQQAEGFTVSENVLEGNDKRIYEHQTGPNTITDSVTDADAVRSAAGVQPPP